MLAIYIGVYKALYDYAPQADEELALSTGDLLYLLEKSDLDEWWKVRKRVVALNEEEVDEPQGLVPSTYIEPAPIIKQCVALYDYDKQTEEELSFKEGETFNVYDLNDPDWLLVGDLSQSQFGFAPSNYVQLNDINNNNQSQSVSEKSLPAHPQLQFAPPPLHPVQKQQTETSYVNAQADDNNRVHEQEQVVDENDEAPPPMPSRPRGDTLQSQGTISSPRLDAEKEYDTGEADHNFDGEFFTWYINEIDGRKKRPVIFSVGKGLIILKPNLKNKKILSSSSSLDNEWRIKDLVNLNHEKKHVFLDLKHPTLSVELHTGSKDVADAIMSILGDMKGAEAAKGLREVARASQASTNERNRKIGALIYDFKAQGKDELSAKEGDEVYVINDSKSSDWWMCENTETGRQGVIPSSYIEIIGTSNLEKLTDGSISRRKSFTSSRGKVVDTKKRNSGLRHRSRDERNKIRERDRQERDKQPSSGVSSDSSKAMPNYHRVRTWIDSSGSFKVEAEFLGCVEGKIHLHKTNGVKIAVAANKLCLEDLEYVEKVTGTSLENYKEEVNRQMQKRSSKGKSGVVSSNRSGTAAINDLSSPGPSKAQSSLKTSEPDYDWFEFFLQCGVDVGYCQRYALNFGREQMDENILEDITPSLLRTLGLREGDILRVMKFLDTKFNRSKTSSDSSQLGGLFTEATGALKDNSSTTDVLKVDANALRSSQKDKSSAKLEDDAWVVKPAARSSEDLSKPPSSQNQPQAPQYTGSLQDLVNIKPYDPNAPKPTTQPALIPNAPALTPVKTAQTGNFTKLPLQITGGLVPLQKTGGLVPATTGGLIPVQPTGFLPIQPTGFMPIQQTGAIPQQFTFNIVPLQTGTTTFTIQKTGGQNVNTLPPTSFGQFQPTLQPGNVTVPSTSFNNISSQQTGPLVPAQRTGGTTNQFIGGQVTGGNNSQFTGGQFTGGFNLFNPQPTNQFTGGFPQTSFNSSVPNQITGGLPQTSFNSTVPNQLTGGFVPQSNFGKQITGGFLNNQTGGNLTGGHLTGGNLNQNFTNAPPTSFGTFGGQGSQNNFAANNGQPFMNQQTNSFSNYTQQFGQQPDINGMSNMFQNTSINGFGQQPQNTFGQPQNTFGQQPQNTFGQPQNTFGQPQNTFNQQPQNTFNQQPSTFGQFPTNTFNQGISLPNQFEGFGNQPLQSQPTGAGFGNAPLQSQQTGRANLLAATPDNPFGF